MRKLPWRGGAPSRPTLRAIHTPECHSSQPAQGKLSQTGAGATPWPSSSRGRQVPAKGKPSVRPPSACPTTLPLATPRRASLRLPPTRWPVDGVVVRSGATPCRRWPDGALQSAPLCDRIGCVIAECTFPSRCSRRRGAGKPPAKLRGTVKNDPTGQMRPRYRPAGHGRFAPVAPGFTDPSLGPNLGPVLTERRPSPAKSC